MEGENSPNWAKNMFGETIGVEAYGHLVRENRRRRLGEQTTEILSMNSDDETAEEEVSV